MPLCPSQCDICYEEISHEDELIRIEKCGCSFCRNCVQQYISACIENGILEKIPCPSHACPCQGVLSFSEIKSVSPPCIFQLYEKRLFEQKLHLNPTLLYCPAPDCGAICDIQLHQWKSSNEELEIDVETSLMPTTSGSGGVAEDTNHLSSAIGGKAQSKDSCWFRRRQGRFLPFSRNKTHLRQKLLLKQQASKTSEAAQSVHLQCPVCATHFCSVCKQHLSALRAHQCPGNVLFHNVVVPASSYYTPLSSGPAITLPQATSLMFLEKAAGDPPMPLWSVMPRPPSAPANLMAYDTLTVNEKHDDRPTSAATDPANNAAVLSTDFIIDGLEDTIKTCPRCHILIERERGCAQMYCKNCAHFFCWHCLKSLEGDVFLRHYDNGPCRGALGHSQPRIFFHRILIVIMILGFALLLCVAAPAILVMAPCFGLYFLCKRIIGCMVGSGQDSANTVQQSRRQRANSNNSNISSWLRFGQT